MNRIKSKCSLPWSVCHYRVFFFFFFGILICNYGWILRKASTPMDRLTWLTPTITWTTHMNTTNTTHQQYRHSPQKTTVSTSRTNNEKSTLPTVIIGFSDWAYFDIARVWYHEMISLGYGGNNTTSPVLIGAHDDRTAQACHKEGIPYALVTPELLGNVSLGEVCRDTWTKNIPSHQHKKRQQTYKRGLFASRWRLVLDYLQTSRYHVMMTDVDNIWRRHNPLSSFEDNDVDVWLAYAGTHQAFPRNVFAKQGFAVCGGMSWWRGGKDSTSMGLVKRLVERCGCHFPDAITCDCSCDDQVVFNQMLYKGNYSIVWDDDDEKDRESSWTWEGKRGVCPKTGARIGIWDRHLAFRAPLGTRPCPNPQKSWIAMPIVVDGSRSVIEEKLRLRDLWEQDCGEETPSTVVD